MLDEKLPSSSKNQSNKLFFFPSSRIEKYISDISRSAARAASLIWNLLFDRQKWNVWLLKIVIWRDKNM